MSETVLDTRDLSMRFGGVQAVNNVNFSLADRELRCLIGPTSVPRPPTIVQMRTSADWPRLKTPGVTISAQFANRHPARPAIEALIVKIAVL